MRTRAPRRSSRTCSNGEGAVASPLAAALAAACAPGPGSPRPFPDLRRGVHDGSRGIDLDGGAVRRRCAGLGRSVGAGGFSLADLYRAEAATPNPKPHKSLINIFLGGGPPHQDMWEIKTEAPSEIRGEFKPINTNVPGIQICEVFEKLAGLMDKAAVIRSVVGCRGGHDALHCE